MPTNDQDSARAGYHAAAEPIDALLSRLGTDAAAGLSPKEASRRRESSDARPLFRKLPRTFGACLGKTLREPALCLLLAVAVISLFFERVALGLFCLLLTAAHTALCAYFLYRADRVDAAMQSAYDTPLCRVLRGGRLLRISAEGVVKGDILLLAAGDIIPADCRLIRADGFAVSERELNAADPRRAPIRLDKDAAALPETAESLRHSPVNMVFAGGMAVSGTALGVVVAVGSETHLGGLMTHIPSLRQSRPVTRFKEAARALSVYNLCLFCLTVPLTALGIFTVGDSYEFLDIFLSALALASVTLTEHTLCRMIHLAAAARRSAALDRDRENSADIKSSAALESLSAMTDLLLVGTAALHDGIHHPECLYVGDKIYRCDRPDADEDALRVAEYLRLYRRGSEMLSSAGQVAAAHTDLADAFCRWAEMDTQAFDLKVKEIRPEWGRPEWGLSGYPGASGIFPTVAGSHRVAVFLTPRFDLAEACTHIFDGLRNRPADSTEGREGINALYRLYREAARQGSIPLFILTETDGERVLYAMLTYAPLVCRKTAGCVKSLEAAGIRVTAMLRDVADSHGRTLAACGLTDRGPSNRPAPAGEDRMPAAKAIDGGCRAFEGCSEDYILQCIADLKAAGRTVGVLSADGRDVPLLAEADVAFTCAPALYGAAEAGYASTDPADAVGSPAEGDGAPDGCLANDRARRACDVAVRRSSSVGGGLLGVYRALQAAECFGLAMDRTLGFILLSQALRLVMTILPLCLGLAVAPAPALLLSGFLLDFLVMAAAAGVPAGSLTPSSRLTPSERCPSYGPARMLTARRAELIAVAAVSALLWGAAGIALLCGEKFGGDLAYYGLLGMFALQPAVFLTGCYRRRDSAAFLTLLCLGLVFVGALAAALVSGLTLLWALVIPPAAAVFYAGLRAVLIRLLPPTASVSKHPKA